MRKFLSIILSMVLSVSILSGCGQSAASGAGEKLHIVTTIFPEYDWVRQILGEQAENAEMTILLDNGVDLHSYQPTVDDMITISESDLFVYVGGESDAWVEGALANASNPDMVVINLMDILGDAVKEEEFVEGMEHDHEHGEEHHDEEHHDEEHHEEEEEHHHENDEHVWLSLRNAKVICNHIAQKLGQIDAANKELYDENAANYIAKLEELDAKYQSAVETASLDTLLFADRFPFRYLVDDYGISYYAAFSGCSAETEASFETIAFLSGKADELQLGSVMTIEGADHSIANTVIQNTSGKDQSILTLDSMQAVTSKDLEAGVTYVSIMESNLDVLKAALNGKGA